MHSPVLSAIASHTTTLQRHGCVATTHSSALLHHISSRRRSSSSHEYRHLSEHHIQSTSRPASPPLSVSPSSPVSPLQEYPWAKEDLLAKTTLPDSFSASNAGLITPPPSPRASPQSSAQSPSVASFSANDRILSCRRDGNLKAVMAEFFNLKKEGTVLTDHLYNLVLDSYANLRREGTPLSPMIKVYDEMVRYQIHPSSSTCAIMVRTLCRRDVEVQKVVAMLRRQSARSPGTVDKSHDIAVLESEENLNKALDIFKYAVAEQLAGHFDVELFNQLLRVLSHYGNTGESLYVYDQMLQFNIQPSSATFAALINLFGRSGDIDTALHYFQKYKDLKSSMPSHDASYVYNALVDAYLKCNQLPAALHVVQEDMLHDNVKLTIVPYNSIIRFYCAEHQPKEAEALVEKLLQDDALPRPDASSYGPILATYCNQDRLACATRVYRQLLTMDISKSYGNLANYALLCLKYADQQASHVLSIVTDMHHAGLEPDPVLAERILTHFANGNDSAEAVRALQVVLPAMSSRAVAKSIGTLTRLAVKIASICKAKLIAILSVARVLQPMCPMGLPLQLAKLIMEAYHPKTPSATMVPLSDIHLLYEAALVAYADVMSLPRGPSFGQMVLTILADVKQQPFQDALDFSLIKRVLEQLQKQGDMRAAMEWRTAFGVPLSKELALPVRQPQDAGVGKETVASEMVMRCLMQGQYEEAVKMLETQLIQPGLFPSPEIMRDAIAFVGKQGRLDIALKVYNLCHPVYASQTTMRAKRAVYMITNSVLIGYAQQEDMIQAKVYYEKIKEMGRYPDGNGYASLLLGTAKCATDEASDALIIYEEAKRHNVKPTTFFYNVVISKLARARKLDTALKLFEEMQEFKVQVNSITYGAIISACVRAGSETHARRLFGEMLSSASYQPRVGPFNNMIQFYVRQQNSRERALEYFNEMRRRHIKPSAHTYKLLMEAYCTIAPYDMPTAYKLLSDMKRIDHLRPEATHYASLIYSYGTLQRDVQSAERVFNEMIKNGIQADEVVYQAMLDTLISNDQLTEAEVLYQENLQRSGGKSSAYIENLFIRGYGQKGDVVKAEQVFNRMTDDKLANRDQIVREPSTYFAMIQTYMENDLSSKAQSTLDRMIQCEFPEKVIAAAAALLPK
ncbi:uncharacterized protein BYT42DRAFT_582581 [Radiomyces spectabilis]|uniref:uncharacterized protein n=1 Tax=Radiomyces spectabilis TaxID=64574 RepID=UPI00221F3150|nr:uncharacterized protein BYT42DRAFT_582581 [Radiomyces spectabilis]KAI8370479.1 hypothetical protein BYT42DRAFT_582581 [Radiomyces spectabilis]